jgi:RNA 2',3'-cyclic 3'-phosphodiesterase
MRAFVSIPVPEAVRREILKAQDDLRGLAGSGDIRWVRPEQMHLTLRFLGEIDPAVRDDLLDAIREACRGFGPIALEAARTGFFPDARRPRVAWIGLAGQVGRLLQLQERLQAATAAFGAPEEGRPFSPHLTLGRIKRLGPRETRALAARMAEWDTRSFGSWKADQVELMQSELHPEGSRYTCVDEVILDAGNESA